MLSVFILSNSCSNQRSKTSGSNSSALLNETILSNMFIGNKFKTAREIKDLSELTPLNTIPTGYANSLPVPRRLSDHTLVIQILYFVVVRSEDKLQYTLPEYCMWLNPVSGEVVKFWKCNLEEIGLENGINIEVMAGLGKGDTKENRYRRIDRFYAISNLVWELFQKGEVPNNSVHLDLINEYYQLFLYMNEKEGAQITVASSPEFFKWINESVKHKLSKDELKDTFN